MQENKDNIVKIEDVICAVVETLKFFILYHKHNKPLYCGKVKSKNKDGIVKIAVTSYSLY
jgi:hypothetical protein